MVQCDVSKLPGLKALIVGLVIGAAGMLFALTPAGVDFEEKVGLAWLVRVRGPIEPPQDVVVVALDRRSAEYLQLPRNRLATRLAAFPVIRNGWMFCPRTS